MRGLVVLLTALSLGACSGPKDNRAPDPAATPKDEPAAHADKQAQPADADKQAQPADADKQAQPGDDGKQAQPADADKQAQPAGAASRPPGPLPKAPLSVRAAKRWPFYEWDSAKAMTFNWRKPGRGMELRVVSKTKGWSQAIEQEIAITDKQANTALTLLSRTQGQFMVSKCPFPRHAVVLFAGEHPVGSINVCFECGDIMIWPPYKSDPAWGEKKSRMYPKLMKSYERTFPKWKQFFGGELKLPLDYKKN